MSVGTAILAIGLSSLYSSSPSSHAQTDAKAGAIVLTALWLSLVGVVVYSVIVEVQYTVLRKVRLPMTTDSSDTKESLTL